MKKIIAVLFTLVLCSMCVFAVAGEVSMKFEIGNMPETGGWISVREYTGAVEAGGTVKVTVYNDSDTEFYCFLSARESEKWLTVSVSEFVYIAPHTSEDVEMTDLAENAYFYLLELREVAPNTTIYIAGSGKPDYTKTQPMSDLISSGVMKAGTVAKMPANGESTPTPTAAPTEEPAASPTVTPTATAQATAEAPTETAVTDTTDKNNNGANHTGIIIIASIAAVAVIGGGLCVYFFVIKKKK